MRMLQVKVVIDQSKISWLAEGEKVHLGGGDINEEGLGR
jgi:hypothetical protein